MDVNDLVVLDENMEVIEEAMKNVRIAEEDDDEEFAMMENFWIQLYIWWNVRIFCFTVLSQLLEHSFSIDKIISKNCKNFIEKLIDDKSFLKPYWYW